MSRRFAILSSMILWDIIGFMLFFKGANLLTFLEIGAMRWIISLACLFGIVKGRFVLKKRICKLIDRLQMFDAKVPFSVVYSKGTLILFASMMALGMIIKRAPVPISVRAFVDLAVGIALMSSWIFVIYDKAIPFGSLMHGRSAQAE